MIGSRGAHLVATGGNDAGGTATPTLGEAWRAARQQIDSLDARLLIEHVAACTHAQLLAEPTRCLTREQVERLAELVRRRTTGEPLAYLVGTAGFYGREFLVSPAVLIPRPETERLVELALTHLLTLQAPRILDLGTGSGIIAITLAKQCPDARVTAVDLSAAALTVAQANANRHAADVEFLCSDWYAALSRQRFELIVANPPYVADGDEHLQKNGLPFEPAWALTGSLANPNGLSCLQRIISEAPAHLVPGGRLLIEHGYDQAQSVRNLLKNSGFSSIASWTDLNGITRISGARIDDPPGQPVDC